MKNKVPFPQSGIPGTSKSEFKLLLQFQSLLLSPAVPHLHTLVVQHLDHSSKICLYFIKAVSTFMLFSLSEMLSLHFYLTV